MTSQAKENLLKWVREGLNLPDIDLVYQMIEEDKQAPYPLHLLVQAITWLRNPEQKASFDLWISGAAPQVIDFQKWKNNHIPESKGR